jgi:hypothetical protein
MKQAMAGAMSMAAAITATSEPTKSKGPVFPPGLLLFLNGKRWT